MVVKNMELEYHVSVIYIRFNKRQNKNDYIITKDFFIQLTMTQALDDIVFKQKRNVYFEGMSGTGKTYKIKDIYDKATNKGIAVGLTASTGFAALNIGGQTLHRYCGILLGKGSVDELVKVIRRNKKSLKRWKMVEMLMIDEISMVGGTLFDKLDELGRMIRRNNNPFGGIQLIISGDFLQLQPINDKFAFQSNVWDKMDFYIEHFNKPYRYPDKKFYELIQRSRFGELTEEDINVLKSRVKPYESSDGIKPSILHSLNADVSDANIKELNRLKGMEYRYFAKDMIPNELQEETVKKFLDSVVKSVLTLKIGAQVMLTKNLDQDLHLVNGSRGVVVRCDESGVEVRFKRGNMYLTKCDFEFDFTDDPVGKKLLVIRSQVPLILAYSVTIHKIQGATLDSVIADIGDSIFTTGMGYVSLSRVRTLEGLFLSNFNPRKIKPNPEALKFVKELQGVNDDEENENDKCSICLASVKEVENITTSCKHVFHTKCLYKWFEKDNRCPLCRTIVNKI